MAGVKPLTAAPTASTAAVAAAAATGMEWRLPAMVAVVVEAVGRAGEALPWWK